VRSLAGNVAILCDFDGTVTVEEVSTSLLDRFSPREWREADQDLLAGRMTLRQTMEREFWLLRASRSEMERFVGNVHLRSGFREFVAASRRHRVPLVIISEGLDFYIRAFLEDKGIDVEYRTNRAVFTGNGIAMEHPFSDAACDHCGTCKKAQLAIFKRKGYTTVYVGDGVSDRCPARHADLLFARDGLLRYCRKERIRCVPYEDFTDVLRVLEGRFWKGRKAARAARPRRRRCRAPSGKRPPAPAPRPRPRRR
jgi:2-hydroxy-3-keto-5-methylthiopentenyl-1-phosphate phosphatase